MKIKFYSEVVSFILVTILVTSCQKYLDQKPDKSLAVPNSLNDLQAMLDDNRRINQYVNNAIGEASADNYYMTTADWSSLYAEGDRSMYIWGNEIFYSQFPNDWSSQYSVVYRANTVLQSLAEIPRTSSNSAAWDNIKGSALFYRAETYHVLVRNYSAAWDSATAENDLGIPLRLTSDFNEPSVRSSVGQSYRQILDDVRTALPLLPIVPKHVMRPSKPAAYALLSRVYLSMRDYVHAGAYADSCLQLFNTLMDFNTINTSATLPFSQFNPETIYYAHGSPSQTTVERGRIDSTLIRSYSESDLRRSAFFLPVTNGAFAFKGHYTGISSVLFTGIATDEVYLTKAECQARLGMVAEAMNTLNTLLVKRWKTGSYVPYTASSAGEALEIILKERRKELLMRDLRWIDIKRLNKEGAGITLKRFANQEYTLAPNDLKFALPLPEYVLSLTGMPQNPR